MALSAFGGFCYKCKTRGHKASDCPNKGGGNKNNNNNSGGGGNNGKGKQKFQGKCHNCGKVGHRAVDCWLKEENKDKRPKGFKVPGETTTVATDGGNKVEYLLCGMTFPDDHELLNDPNVWIADTGATVHHTPHQCGLNNVREATKSDAITMGNGESEEAVRVADISGTIYNQNGIEIGPAKMTDVVVIPTGKFNWTGQDD